MKHTHKIIFCPILVFLVYLILDYINLPNILNIKIANINVDLFGVLLNSAIVISLYLFSYYYIEKRQKIKDENAKNVVKVLIEKTYRECLKTLQLLDKEQMIKYVISKVDFNKTVSDNPVITSFQKLPFTSFDTIMSLATSGHISDNDFKRYVEIQKEYEYLVNMKITLFDLSDYHGIKQDAMANDISTRTKALENELNTLIKANSKRGGINQ